MKRKSDLQLLSSQPQNHVHHYLDEPYHMTTDNKIHFITWGATTAKTL